jgi:Caspase domain
VASRLALLIGTGKFRDRSLSRLLTTTADVRDLSRVLREVSEPHFDSVVELVDGTADQARREIERIFRNRRRDELVLLYYSGHGIKDDEGHVHLAMEDTDSELLSATAIPASFVLAHRQKSFSRRQLLILDCCFSGAFVAGAKAGGQAPAAELGLAFSAGQLSDVRREPSASGFGRVIMTACDANSYAMSNDRIEGSSNSLFTHFLLRGLEGAAADVQGRIDTDDLYRYAYEGIAAVDAKRLPHFGGEQQGNLVLSGRVESRRPLSFPPSRRSPSRATVIAAAMLMLCAGAALSGAFMAWRMGLPQPLLASDRSERARPEAQLHVLEPLGLAAQAEARPPVPAIPTLEPPAGDEAQLSAAQDQRPCYHKSGYDPSAGRERYECERVTTLKECQRRRERDLRSGSLWMQANCEVGPCRCEP